MCVIFKILRKIGHCVDRRALFKLFSCRHQVPGKRGEMFAVDACSAVSGRVSNPLRSSSTAREISALLCQGLPLSFWLSFPIVLLYLHDTTRWLPLSMKSSFPKAELAGTCCISQFKTGTCHSRQPGEQRSTTPTATRRSF